MGFGKPNRQNRTATVTKAEAARLNGKKGGRPRKVRALEPLLNGETPAETQPAAAPLVLETKTPAPETQPAAATPETQPADTPPRDTAPEVLPAPENPFNLTARELLFVEAWCGPAHFNASDAYRLAGFSGKPTSISANAARLIGKDRVAQAIQAKLAGRLHELAIMDGDEALGRISAHARADIRQLFPPDSPIAQLSDEVARSIKAITPTRYGQRIELYDALRAAELMAKSAGKLKETVKLEHTLEDILALANRPPDGAAA
jgi:hypothetical protein